MEATPIEKAHAIAVLLRGRLAELSERQEMSAADFRAMLSDLAQAMDGHCDQLKALAGTERAGSTPENDQNDKQGRQV